ncbi:unnamed protein product [Effrenium voratum]|nr:unnamed protein product [Effrenium voratum]
MERQSREEEERRSEDPEGDGDCGEGEGDGREDTVQEPLAEQDGFPDERSGSNRSFNEQSGQRQDDQLMADEPEQLRAFLVELLMRRALLLRLMGNLDGAGSDFADVLELEPEEGLALFWHGKILLEQQRHQEAGSYLQASIQYHEPTQMAAHAILGALLMIRADPDFGLAQRHLKEAARLAPESQPVRITLWICSAAVALSSKSRDPNKALGLLDRALAALEADARSDRDTSGCRSARATCSHAAGSGISAAAALSARSRSAEEARWLATRALVKSQQALAKGDDLEQALQCRTFLQLVAREPSQRAASVPSLLFQLRVTAFCDLCRWEEALADCRQAMVVDPGDESTAFTMYVASGILKFQDLKFEAAIGCFTKAIRMQPVNMQARLHRAIALSCAAWARGMEGSAQETARVVQLLADAVQDLEAVEQQAMISGITSPIGAGHLRAACLCSLGRPDDAWEALCDSGRRCAGRRSNLEGHDPCAPRQRALEAEVLVLLKRYSEAIEACSAVLALNSRGHADARLMRGWCLSEIGEVEAAFEDIVAAVSLAPERADVHEVYGDICLQYGRLSEAYHAFGNAMKLSEPMAARLCFKRALAQLRVGNLGGAEHELSRAVKRSRSMPSAVRAKDGVGVLSAMLKCEWRHAHVRLNMMIHQSCGLMSASSTAADGLPVIFLPHELMVYRGAASLYLGDTSTAIQDFAAALELARHLFQDEANWETAELPEEAASREGLLCFECECTFNLALCQVRARDYVAALASIEKLCDRLEDLPGFGSGAYGLSWFLAGICHLALDAPGSSETNAKEAFSRSYSYDAAYVDDFLSRHGSQQSSVEVPDDRVRPVGSCPPISREGGDVPTVVCCMQPQTEREPDPDGPDARGTQSSGRSRRLLSPLPPIRLKVRDVTIWARPSVSWPFVRPSGWKPPTSLARLDFLQQRDPLSMAGQVLRFLQSRKSDLGECWLLYAPVSEN